MRPLAHLLFVTFCGCVSALTDAEIALFVARTHIETNTGVQGTVSVTISSTDSTVIDLSSNGVPDHATGRSLRKRSFGTYSVIIMYEVK